MSTADVWTHADAVAGALRSSPQVRGLQRVFDHDDRGDAWDPGETALNNLVAGMGMLGSRPLLVGIYAPILPPLPMPGADYNQLLRIPEFRALIDDARPAAETLLGLIEHIRSRLPGYPDIPVPSLRAQAPSVEMDGLLDSGMPWPAALRLPGARSERPPRATLANVEADAWQQAISSLVEAVERTAERSAFVRATASLTDDGRRNLEEACEEFDERTTPDRLDQEAGGYLISRAAYTRALLAEVTTGLTDDARDYLDSFHHIDRLVSQVGMVISDRTIHTRPVEVPLDAQVSWQRDGGSVVVNARFSAEPFLKPGRLLTYEGLPPTRGAWIGTATTMNFDMAPGGFKVGLDAYVLPDSEILIELTGEQDAEGPP